MKKRVLRFEPLEDRRLLAVAAGLEIPLPEPTAAVPAGAAVGDVYIASTLDADGDGFIGPAELSYMSHAWFASGGGERWNPASDLDGDGFVGPGDYALLSSYWFKTNDELPESTRSYRIYPSDTGNWILFGDQISKVTANNGTLTVDAQSGALEALCDYGAFRDDILVTADFKGTGSFRAGIELAVQDSGARYYAEFRNDGVSLYYVGEGESFTLLHSVSRTFVAGRTYTVWMHVTGGQLACGVQSETLIALDETRLSGGGVGFYASGGIGAFSNIRAEFDPERVENTVNLPEAGKQILITDSATGLSYWLFIPTDTSARTKDGFPLMLFLHGSGERGNPANVKVHGPPMLLENGWAETWPFITVSPSCPSGATWSASQLLSLLDEVVEWLPADGDRIYVTGVSMGGHGTWDLLLADPDRFAAAAPICGWSDPSRAPLLVDVPIWVFHGDADTQVSWKNSSNMVDAIRAAGGTKVEFTLYPGVGHNSWTVTYNNRDLYTWFLRQSK